MLINTPDPRCRVCGGDTEEAGAAVGTVRKREYHLRRCPACGYGFVADPWTDYDSIYDDAYYRGQGADPLVDYVSELESPEVTVRQHEWRGMVSVVSSLAGAGPETMWLDYGCGTGGLVRHLRSLGWERVSGFEQGWAVPRLRRIGVPLVAGEQLPELAGRFDVVTAIEVIEHVVDPVSELRTMAELLRPGGLLFLTTGNAAPHAADLPGWSYVRPEIHVSFFEPRTLATAMKRVGLSPSFPGPVPGWDEILRFKILKNLGRKRASRLDRVLLPAALCRLADRRLGVSAHPVGWRSPQPDPTTFEPSRVQPVRDPSGSPRLG